MPELIENDPTIVTLINDYGFPIILAVGMGYFIYYVWQFISNELEPQIDKMHMALIRLIDQVRMLDQDMIRLQQKVNVVLEYREIPLSPSNALEDEKYTYLVLCSMNFLIIILVIITGSSKLTLII